MRYLQLLLVTGLLSAWGCSSISVTADHDPDIDFATYKTYEWYDGKMPEGDALSQDPLLKKRVMHSVNTSLKGKGLKEASDETSNFVIIIHAGTQEKMQVTNYGYGGYGYGRYYGGWGGYGGSYTDVTYYDEATLIIDFVDVKKKELTWRGTATGVVKNYSSAEERQARLDDVVGRILAKFPPGTSN